MNGIYYIIIYFISNIISFHCINNFVLNFAGMGSSDPMEKPWTWRYAGKELGEAELVPVKCWCGDDCVSKQSTDWDETRGRRFWMCPNYAHDPPKPKNTYDRPKVCVLLCT